MSERYFEDYPAGTVFISAGSIEVGEADIIDFARKYDPQLMQPTQKRRREGISVV